MKVWGVTEHEIRAAAQAVGLRLHEDYRGTGIVRDGRALRFRLALDTEQPRDETGALPYQRVSQSHYQTRQDGTPRRIAAVCWHGHRDYLRALFALAADPEAVRVKSALADYRGSSDFERTYRDTFGHGNGWNRAARVWNIERIADDE